jgi:signal transduction histidine kinase/PAS domain-containing protein
MQRDDDKYIDLSMKDREVGDLTNVNLAGTVTLTEIQAIADRQYRVLFEMMTQGVICQDADGHIVMANSAAQTLLGYSFEELRGRTSFDPCWQARKSDGSPFPGDEHPAMLALRTGKPVKSVIMSLFHPKESAHRWLIVNAVPLFRPNERVPFQVYTTLQDQMELNHQTDISQASEQQALVRVHELEAVFEAISDNVAVYDQQGHVVEMSEPLREMLLQYPQSGSKKTESRTPLPNTLQPEEVSIGETKTPSEFAPDSPARSSDGDEPLPLESFALRDEQGHLLSDERMPIWRLLRGEVISSSHSVDIVVRTRGGVERYLSISGSPMYDETKTITGAVAIIQDVTVRRELERRTQRALDAILAMAEALVQDTHEEFQSAPIVDGAQPSLADTLVERSLVELPCRLLDCQRVGIALLDPETDMLQPMIVVGISPEHEHHWRNSLQGARLQNFLGDARLVARLRSGQVLSLDASLPLFRDHPSYKMITPIMKGNHLLGILLLGYGRNQPTHTQNELAIIQAIARLASLVIEREKARNERDQALMALQTANHELERANKVKSNFVSMVSHEFRTALTGIQGFSEIIRDGELTLPEAREFAVDIFTDARRLGRMINDMLDLDRMEAGRMELSLGWTDLNAIILDVVAHMRPNASNHSLRLQLANALPILPGDYDKLTQVMTNLLDNAIKYSPDGGEIVITSVVEGNMVQVSVKDNGLGIAPVDLERIFERYARAGSGKTRFIEGTGLGLPIVREIIQMHGGQVWAESLQGKGSVFHFTMPFTERHPISILDRPGA